MTDYAKWDKIVADISDEEEEDIPIVENPKIELKMKPGEGASLSEHGVVQGVDRPGNARGNALSTNKEIDPIKYLDKASFTWDQDDERINIKIPLDGMGVIQEEGVHVGFTNESFRLKLTNQDGTEYMLECSSLPLGGIVPEQSSMKVHVDPGKTKREDYSITLVLKKSSNCRWQDLGRIKKPKVLPEVAVESYSWRDEERGAYVYLKIPGVHELPPERVKVRFRELSFDVRCEDLRGKNYNFAVTELPMEVVIERCRFVVDDTDGGRVKIYLRKWARTSWRKLQVHR